MLKPVQHDVEYSRFLNRRFHPNVEMTMKPTCHSEPPDGYRDEESHLMLLTLEGSCGRARNPSTILTLMR